jgi:hypothetical protein
MLLLLWDHHARISAFHRANKPWPAGVVFSTTKMLLHGIDGHGSDGNYGVTKMSLFCDARPSSNGGSDASQPAREGGGCELVGRSVCIGCFNIKMKEVRLVDGLPPMQETEYSQD